MTTAILLSGGIDSISLAFWKKPSIAFTIDYGQIPAQAEIRASAKICEELSIKHEIIRVDCSKLGSGDLSSNPACNIAPVTEWWPFRNQLLITLASMRAIALDVNTILCGSVASDSIHIDGSLDFYKKVNDLVSLQEGSIHINVPAINMTSKELIEISKIDIELLSWAHSCHTSNFACGQCHGCNKHKLVFAELGYNPY